MTVAQVPFNNSGTGTAYCGVGLDLQPKPSRSGSVHVAVLRRFLRMMFLCPAMYRKKLKNAIAEFLENTRDKEQSIDVLLRVCSSEGGPDGLDTGVDILSNTGQTVIDYAGAYILTDVGNWSPGDNSDEPYQPNNDYWYILLRSVARADGSANERFRIISACQHARSRGIREGVVEALGDLGTTEARAMLQRLSNDQDEDDSIRKLAQQMLDDAAGDENENPTADQANFNWSGSLYEARKAAQEFSKETDADY